MPDRDGPGQHHLRPRVGVQVAALCCALLYSDRSAGRLEQLAATPGLQLEYENSYYPDFVFYWLALWAGYMFAQQQTVSLLLVVKSSYTAAMASLYLATLYLVLGSGTVRSLSALPELMYHLTYIVQPRYSGAILNGLEFYEKTRNASIFFHSKQVH